MEQQFMKFILMYLLCDIDLVKNVEYVKNSIEEIKIPVLKYAIMMKILYYYHFKAVELSAANRSSLDKILKESYAEVGASFNKSVYNKNAISRIFNRVDQERIVDRQKNK